MLIAPGEIQTHSGMVAAALPFREIWAVDFEYQAADGHLPAVICMVALELSSGKVIKLWRDELLALKAAPFPTDEGVLFIAYYASAEIGVFLELGWPIPTHIVDLFVEFRAKTNGQQPQFGAGLVGALLWHGLETRGAEDKAEMRALIMDRSSMVWTLSEKRKIINYCLGDVEALARLWPRMLPYVTCNDKALPQALFRGRYMTAAARMEREGIPIDTPLLRRLQAAWDPIKATLIAEVDWQYDVYSDGKFNVAAFDKHLSRNRIVWPRTPSGLPLTSGDTFRSAIQSQPQLRPLLELRSALSELKLHNIAIGPDDRNRTLLSAFRARSGRNQPSNARFVFGPAKWIRWLIVPPEGQALAYIDWRSQEIAIAAGLSKDPLLAAAYATDPYLHFAIQSGLAPENATKATHGGVRDQCKALVLGVNYGMGAQSLAFRSGLTVSHAKHLLSEHQRIYPAFWDFVECTIDRVMSGQTYYTRFGWPLRVTRGDYNPRSIQNHPMQAGGADCMRLAACLATEAGHRIAAPVHDALLLIGDERTIEEEAREVASMMTKVGEVVTGIPVDADIEITRSGNRYQEKRGEKMFHRLCGLLQRIENGGHM